MTTTISLASKIQTILDKPCLLPIKIILYPFLWTISKVERVVKFALGRLLRLGVFPFCESQRSFFGRNVIKLFSGGCCDNQARGRFDPERLKQAFKVLLDIGGIRSKTYTKDGFGLDTMLFRFQDVKENITKHGGHIQDCLPIHVVKEEKNGKDKITFCNQENSDQFVDIILPNQNQSSTQWDIFCKNTLDKLGLEKAEVTLENGTTVKGYIIKYWKKANPTRPKPGLCFIRCNAPTESYGCAKRDILRHVLSLRGDMLCFDQRGTWLSDGVASEEGYYADAEAIAEKAVFDYGYSWKDLWAVGFCEGGAIASYLKKKYHKKGINLSIQNSFDKLRHTLEQQVTPANYLAPYVIEEIQTYDPKLRELIEGDLYDTTGKFNSLDPDPEQGDSFIVNATPDPMVCGHSHQRLVEALVRVSKRCFHYIYESGLPNAHSLDVLGERDVWDRFVEWIADASNGREEVKNS